MVKPGQDKTQADCGGIDHCSINSQEDGRKISPSTKDGDRGTILFCTVESWCRDDWVVTLLFGWNSGRFCQNRPEFHPKKTKWNSGRFWQNRPECHPNNNKVKSWRDLSTKHGGFKIWYQLISVRVSWFFFSNNFFFSQIGHTRYDRRKTPVFGREWWHPPKFVFHSRIS